MTPTDPENDPEADPAAVREQIQPLLDAIDETGLVSEAERERCREIGRKYAQMPD